MGMPEESGRGRTVLRSLTDGERQWELVGLIALVAATVAYAIGSIAAGESLGAQAPLAVVAAGLTIGVAVLVGDFDVAS